MDRVGHAGIYIVRVGDSVVSWATKNAGLAPDERESDSVHDKSSRQSGVSSYSSFCASSHEISCMFSCSMKDRRMLSFEAAGLYHGSALK